jgi:hypothetical protein
MHISHKLGFLHTQVKSRWLHSEVLVDFSVIRTMLVHRLFLIFTSPLVLY